MIDTCLTDCQHCEKVNKNMIPFRMNFEGFDVILSFHCEFCDKSWEITYRFESVE